MPDVIPSRPIPCVMSLYLSRPSSLHPLFTPWPPSERISAVFSYNPIMRNVHFYNEVSRALFEKRKRTWDYLERIPSANLADVDEVTSRCSGFQRMVRFQKQPLHERHLQTEKWCLPMRKDIIEAIWKISIEIRLGNVTHSLIEQTNLMRV